MAEKAAWDELERWTGLPIRQLLARKAREQAGETSPVGSRGKCLTVPALIEQFKASEQIFEGDYRWDWLEKWWQYETTLELPHSLWPAPAELLREYMAWLKTQTYVPHKAKCEPKPLSPTTIRNYLKMARRVRDWGVATGRIQPPLKWEDGKLPREGDGHKHLGTDRVEAGFDDLSAPSIAMFTCPKCKQQIAARGQRRHLECCTGKGYKPKYDAKRVTHGKALRVLQLAKFGMAVGARPSEACLATWDQVFWAEGYVVIPEHKNKTKDGGRKLPLTPAAREVLEHQKQKYGTEGYIFKSRLGGPYTPAGVRSILKRHGLKGGYALRHEFAMQCIRMGIDLAKLSKWLGHKSYKTTQIYADLEMDEAIKAGQKLVLPLRLGRPQEEPKPSPSPSAGYGT